MPVGLLERETELARMQERMAAAARGEGGALLVRGAAGIGKTRLLAAARAAAPELGMRVLAARGGELEREFPFAVARQLLRRPLEAAGEAERAALLAGPARAAAAALLDDRDALPREATDAERRFAMFEGLVTVVERLAEAGPLLLVVDDLHWVDEPSLRWLGYLTPRLAGTPVLLLGATRPPEPGADATVLDAVTGDPGAELLHPAPLSARSSLRVVQDRLRAADPAFAAACHEVSRGNPFFLGEVLTHVVTSGLAPDAAGAERLAELVPDTVVRAVAGRLARLAGPATALARAVAILGEHATVDCVAALSGLDAHVAGDVAGQLRAAGVLHDGQPLGFVHPIVRAAVHDAMPSAERSAAHGRAARLLGDADPHVLAGHLLQADATGDRWAVDRLREGARLAAIEGQPELTARLLRRALAEPPPEELRSRILVRLGAVESSLGEGAAALAHLTAGLEAATDPGERARATLDVARTLLASDRIPDAVRVLESTLDFFDDGSSDDLVRALECDLVGVAWFDTTARELRQTRLARIEARARPGTTEERMAFAYRAMEDAVVCRPAAGVADLAERAIADGELLGISTLHSPAVYVAAYALTLAGRLDVAERHLDEVVEAMDRRGLVAGLSPALAFRARLRHLTGDLPGAADDVRRGLALGRGGEAALGRPMLAAVAVGVALERGDLEGAAAQIAREEFDADGADVPDTSAHDYLLLGRARVRQLRGDLEGALADALLCGERETRWGARNPAGAPWRSEAAHFHVLLGDHDAARELAASEVADARTFGAPAPIARALRAAAAAEPGRAVDLLEEALAVVAPSAARLERARTQAALGLALRDAGAPGAARDALLAARADAQRCGALALVRVAGDALAEGDRRRTARATDAATTLSAQERRVALMARDEMTNREIAAELGIADKTVEVHLSRAYKKLGVRSRFQLAEALPRTD